jgi:hypothetical protein
MVMARQWSKDKRPARQRYWDRHVLENRKVRNILANKQRIEVHSMKGVTSTALMTESDARRWWQKRRKGRVPDKYIPLTIR